MVNSNQNEFNFIIEKNIETKGIVIICDKSTSQNLIDKLLELNKIPLNIEENEFCIIEIMCENIDLKDIEDITKIILTHDGILNIRYNP